MARLGLVMLRQGRHERATSHLRQALALQAELGNHSGEAEALNGLGEAFLAASQADCARTHHHDALVLARQAGDTYEQARAHRGLAAVWQATGDSQQASRHWRQALASYSHLGVVEAEQMPTADGGGRG